MSRRIWLVILLAAALYLIGNGRVQLWDRDEPRYAQTSRQMLQTGEWVVPTYLDEPRLKKPPLIYWCQAACMAWLSPQAVPGRPVNAQIDAFAARLPSAIATILTLLLLGSTLARIADERRAFWAVLVMATSGLVIMAAKMCLTDAVLLLFVTAGQLMVYALWLGQRDWWTVTVFAAATGLALLTKGPVALAVNGMTLLVLWVMRWWDLRAVRRAGASAEPKSEIQNPQSEITEVRYSSRPVLKSIYALLVVLAIGAPWAILVKMKFGGALWDVIYKEVILRVSTPLEQHKGPPGYYLAFFFASFFPWCVLLPTALVWAWRRRREPLIRFSFAAVVGPWLMFEVIQTKLPHYVLPCFPFLAILVAEVIASATPGRIVHRAGKRRPATFTETPPEIPALVTELTGNGFKIGVKVWAGALVVVGLAPWIVTLGGVNFGLFRVPEFGFDRLPYVAMAAVSVAGIVLAVITTRFFLRDRVAAGARWLGASMFVIFALLFALYLPRARFLHLSEEVGGFLQASGGTAPGEVYMIDYKEDTLPFYQGGTIRKPPKELSELNFLTTVDPDNWPEFIVLTREVWEKTPESARAKLQVLKTFRGWAYAAKGRIVDVMVLAKRRG